VVGAPELRFMVVVMVVVMMVVVWAVFEATFKLHFMVVMMFAVRATKILRVMMLMCVVWATELLHLMVVMMFGMRLTKHFHFMMMVRFVLRTTELHCMVVMGLAFMAVFESTEMAFLLLLSMLTKRDRSFMSMTFVRFSWRRRHHLTPTTESGRSPAVNRNGEDRGGSNSKKRSHNRT